LRLILESRISETSNSSSLSFSIKRDGIWNLHGINDSLYGLSKEMWNTKGVFIEGGNFRRNATSLICLITQKDPRGRKSSLSHGRLFLRLRQSNHILSPMLIIGCAFWDLLALSFLLVLSSKKFILHLCINLRQLSSKVFGYWIFHIVEVELIKLWMVSIVGKERGLMSRSLDGIRVVILGVRRLTGGRAGGLAHYAERKPGVLDIFSEYSFKIPRIYLNMLEYTRIFPCRVGVEVYRARRAGGPGGRAGGRAHKQPRMVLL
jgi:hypothetical protein